MNLNKKPLLVALGAAFALAGSAQAAPLFEATDLASGYMLASNGDDKKAEHSCGEGGCGASMKPAAAEKKAEAKPAADKTASAGTTKPATEQTASADKKPN